MCSQVLLNIYVAHEVEDDCAYVDSLDSTVGGFGAEDSNCACARVTVIETPIREFAEWHEERSELSPETTYAVASLTALEGLSLFDNQISDIEPLASLTARWLDLHNTSITDIDALAGLLELRRLDWRETDVESRDCPVQLADVCLFSLISALL